VNMRSQIHSAIDHVSPPAPTLPHDAVAYVLSNGRRRTERPARRQPRWAIGMRQAGTLVAAVLVIVMMVTLVVGGRLWRDWNTQQQNAARQAHIAQLRERPLHLPAVNPGDECPESPFNLYLGYPAGYGSGPVYAKGSGYRYVTDSGTYFDTKYWLGDVEVSGPVLIRARDVKTNQSVVFAKSPYGSVAGTPTGETMGTAVVIGQTVELHAELLLDPTQLTTDVQDWETLQGFPKGTSGCIGFQVDGVLANGSAFSEVIAISYLMS
jgi:hypothetical protein